MWKCVTERAAASESNGRLGNHGRSESLILSLQESAHARELRAQLVVERIVERQQPSCGRTQTALHFRAQQPLLVLLLRLIPSRVVDVHGAPMRRSAIG